MPGRTAASGEIPETVWTVGHSTRPVAELLDLLSKNDIGTVADVRRYPASRRYPHFNREPLATALAAESIGYEWIESLGGRRQAREDSSNIAWRNAAFRGYADHMGSEEFAAGFASLCKVATRNSRTAVMCSEAVWWRCHRGLIADLLSSLGTRVLHIVSAAVPEEHPWTAAARLDEGVLTYDSRRGEPAARLQLPSQHASLL